MYLRLRPKCVWWQFQDKLVRMVFSLYWSLTHTWTTDCRHLTLDRLHCQDDARHFKATDDSGFRIFNNFATYFCMEMPHFECGWLIGEEICLSRWYQFSFNIHPQLFLQEIAILFIYYLFIGLLDLIEFENEKAFSYRMTAFSRFPSSLLYTH